MVTHLLSSNTTSSNTTSLNSRTMSREIEPAGGSFRGRRSRTLPAIIMLLSISTTITSRTMLLIKSTTIYHSIRR